MRCRSASLLVGFVALAPLGCEATPPPVAPPPPPVTAPPVDEVKPAPEPADLLGVVRWKNPQQTAAALSACAGVPGALAEGVTKPGLALLFKELFRGSDAKALAEIVATDVPVDAAFALEQGTKNPKGMGAFAIGLRSLDGAKSAFDASGGVVEVAPGLFKIASKNRDLTCGIAQAAGPTPARLVCGGRERDLVELGPWLARTAPMLPSAASDLHGDLRWAPFDKRFGQEVRTTLKGLPLIASAAGIGDSRFDRALGDAASAIADEVAAEAGDADRLTVDLAVDPATCLTISGGLYFRGHASWLVKQLTDRPERQGAPPEIFWRAPKDSESAIYSRGGEPAAWKPITQTVQALVEGWLSKHGVAAADAKAVADLLNLPMSKDTDSVSASGHDAGPPPKLAANAKPQAVMDALASGYLGWNLVGVDAGGDAIAKWFKDAAAAYNRAGVHKAIAGELRPSSVKNMPIVKVGQGPAALGKGSLDVEIRVNDIEAPEAAISKSKSGKPDVVSFVGHILVMQDGKGAWVAIGANRDDLVKRLVAAKSGGPDATTLASRPGLEGLKGQKLLSGGFVTLAPFTKTMGTGLSTYAAASGGGLPMLSDAANALENLPHHGATPMYVMTKVAGDGSHVEMSVNLPKGSLEDIGAMVATGIRIANTLRGGGP